MINLAQYGYTPFFMSQVKDNAEDNIVPARVIAVHRAFYKVVSANGETGARLGGSFRHEITDAAGVPVVGDFVTLRHNASGDSTITAVLERKSKFSRPDYAGHSAEYAKTILEQVIAANFDYVFIMVSLNHDFNVNRIARYLAAAKESGSIPVVILTKADLTEDYSEQLRAAESVAAGIDIVVVSAHTGYGIDRLAEYVKQGRTFVFLGSSGVGKSSLVNSLAGEEIMTVSGIREDDSKGRHTTTHRQLVLLKNGAMIIDTPGIREIGMWNAEEGLKETFSDVEQLLGTCRFSDCTHGSEPGCAILAAIEQGVLDEDRWNQYLNLKKENRFVENKSAYLNEKKTFFKKIKMEMREQYRKGEKKGKK